MSTRDIATLISEGAAINRTAVELNAPIKSIGQYKVPLALHPDVEVSVTITWRAARQKPSVSAGART